MTSSTKTEVRFPTAAGEGPNHGRMYLVLTTENLVKLGYIVLEKSKRTDRENVLSQYSAPLRTAK